MLFPGKPLDSRSVRTVLDQHNESYLCFVMSDALQYDLVPTMLANECNEDQEDEASMTQRMASNTLGGVSVCFQDDVMLHMPFPSITEKDQENPDCITQMYGKIQVVPWKMNVTPWPLYETMGEYTNLMRDLMRS